jgi:hypothetical protein
MRRFRFGYVRWFCLAAAFCSSNGFAPAQLATDNNTGFPCPEKLSYRIEWRLITAGSATVEMSRSGPVLWQTNLNLESAGLVSRLYRVLDRYTAISNDKFCAATSTLDAQEGKRHTITRLTFENTRHAVSYDERDLLKNSTVKKELDVAPCTYEIAGAFEALRQMNLPPGKWATLPITDGKKMAYAKVESQGKERVIAGGKTYQTLRYEAFLFDNVLYKRKGRLQIWISDDSDRIPVQLRLQMGFPIGSVTVELEKEQKS